jgi:ubiquinone/menaquinone biosynthesis C-methylase UbiE
VVPTSPDQPLREIFNEAAELYDRVRPGYPPRLFDDLAELAGLGSGSRVLEIGCGTGQATVPLAERVGHPDAPGRVVAVELGARLAAVARRKIARFRYAEVVVSTFEDWPLPDEPFDIVVAATSFHWIDPAVRVGKAADALRTGGALAIVETHHIAGGTEGFFVDVQDCYERFDPATPPGLRQSSAAQVPADGSELDSSGRFGPVIFRRYEWEQAYRADEYLDLLRTYSGHRALPEPARRGLLECVAQLINSRYGGQITKRYLTQLVLAHRS